MKKIRHLIKIIKIAVTLFLFIYIFHSFGISLSSISIDSIESPIWILLSILIVTLVNPLWSSSRWKVFLEYSGVKIKRFELIKIAFISYFYGLVLPSSIGSDVIRIYLIEKKYPEIRGRTGATVFGDRLVGLSSFALIGLFGSIYIEKVYGINKIIGIMLIINIVVLFLSILLTNNFVYKFFKLKLSCLSFMGRTYAYLDSLHENLVQIKFSTIIPKVLPFIILFQLSNIGTVWFIFMAAGFKINFFIHLAFVPVIMLISMIPASISGFGLREGAFVYFYNLINVPPEVSIVVSILFFIVNVGSPSIIGGIWSLISNVKRDDIKIEKEHSYTSN